MSDIAIRCQGLSKQYRIGQHERYKALRDVITDAATAPFRRLGRAMNNGNGSSALTNRSSVSGATRVQTPIDSGLIWALDDVSFEVKRGDVVGVIGRNGAGKSTLLKILSRITKPTKGHAEIHGRIGSLLEVGTGFHPELTGRENVYLNGAILGMRKAEIDRKFDEIVAFAEVEKFIDTPVKRYSSGMYVRLAFAVAAHMETEILLVDEVLAVGDAQFQKKCMGKLGEVAKQGRTVLFVSHNLVAIRRLCSRTLLLDHGRVVADDKTPAIIEKYESRHLEQSENLSPAGTIFEEPIATARDYHVFRIDMLDELNRPKARLATWDRVKFRLYYHARQAMNNGSAVFKLSTLDEVTLLLCSTQPDSNVPMEILRGTHCVDCEFVSWPLAAGHYLVSAALAVPMKEWLTTLDQRALLTVEETDVFQSGRVVPNAGRALLALPHTWHVKTADPADIERADLCK